MRFALVLVLLVMSLSPMRAQTEWGLSLSPLLSKGRLPSGVGVGYAGPPYFSGDLVVEERSEPGFSIELFRESQLRWKHFSIHNSIGFVACGSYQHFDYDYANSINNIVSVENRFNFLTLMILPMYNLKVNQVIFFSGFGPHIDYMIRSMETSRNYINGEISEDSYNFLSQEERLNYGIYVSIGVKYKRVFVSTFYRSFYKPPVHHADRRIINFGLSGSVILWK